MTAYEKFNEIKTAYLSSLQTITKSKNTLDKYSRVLNDFALWLEKNDCEQTEITAVMILKYSHTVKDRGTKNNTLGNYLTILHSFFKWTVAHKFYTENPVLKEDMPKKERIEYDLLSEQEVNRILSGELPPYTQNPERTKAIVFMFLLAGLRVSELISLRVGDLDLVKGSVTVVGKGDKLRTSALPKPLVEVLQAYLTAYNKTNADELLFNSVDGKGNQKPYTRQNITKLVEGYINRLLGHRHIGAHDLRHSFASLLLTNGASLEKIQQMLGHASYSTTLIYAEHLCPNRVVEEVNDVFNNLPVFACN